MDLFAPGNWICWHNPRWVNEQHGFYGNTKRKLSKDYLELLHPTHNKTDEVSVTCLGFPDNETTTFWVGTEEGNVYQAGRYDQAGR